MIALALLLATAAAPTPKIAVLDVRLASGVDAALGPFLTQVIAGEVADRTGSSPLVSADIRDLLGFERQKQMLGCSEDDSSCLAEIGGALGVSRVVAASVSVSGERYLVTISLLDTQKARPLGRAAESTAHDHDSLITTVRWSVYKLFGGAPPAQPRTSASPQAAAVPAAAKASPANARRTWALVAGGASIVLAGTAAALGISALSTARSGDGSAKPRAHLADALYAGAIVCAGVGVSLWIAGRPAQVSAAASPAGGALVARVAW